MACPTCTGNCREDATVNDSTCLCHVMRSPTPTGEGRGMEGNREREGARDAWRFRINPSACRGSLDVFVIFKFIRIIRSVV